MSHLCVSTSRCHHNTGQDPLNPPAHPTHTHNPPTVLIEHHLCCCSSPLGVSAGLCSALWMPRAAQFAAVQRHIFSAHFCPLCFYNLLQSPGFVIVPLPPTGNQRKRCFIFCPGMCCGSHFARSIHRRCDRRGQGELAAEGGYFFLYRFRSFK